MAPSAGGRAGRWRHDPRPAMHDLPHLQGALAMNAQVLDPCSASRMIWFDKGDQRALFGDIRDEEHLLCDGRVLKVEPDVIMDFRKLPFPDASFSMVVFDPPHLVRAGRESWLRLKYGILTDDWREDLRQGFAECFRVLKPG